MNSKFYWERILQNNEMIIPNSKKITPRSYSLKLIYIFKHKLKTITNTSRNKKVIYYSSNYVFIV